MKCPQNWESCDHCGAGVGEECRDPDRTVRVGKSLDDALFDHAVATGPLPPFTSSKDTNPKDAVGTRKVPTTTLPWPVVAETGVALLEGARKYGRHNYRVAGIRNSVYFDATMRHLMSWWEGEDIDPDSGMSHITKAIASLMVLRDAQINNMATDDRPPRPPEDWLRDLQSRVDDIFERYPEALPAHTHAT